MKLATTRDRSLAPAPARIGLATLLTVLGSCSGPALAGLPSPSPPPVYCAFVALLFALITASCARSLVQEIGNHRARPRREAWRSEASSLARFTAAVADPHAVEEAVASFPEVLAATLRVEDAALYLKREGGADLRLAAAVGPASATDETSPAAVAEGEETYARYRTWLPLVASGVEVGRVGLGPALAEPDLPLASLLCGSLALLLRNADSLARLSSQSDEIENLRRRVDEENAGVQPEVRRPENFRDIVGASEALRRTLALVERMAPSEVPILVTGETGTGKELIARAVHELSGRGGGPLVTVNCPAIPGPLAESELFGHERGAFTDAISARPGQFELAHGGTIFLDEIGDLPLDIQAKLLRVLQQGEVQRVGGQKLRPVDVRAIAATNRDLVALVRAGRFREDLYYRLAAVEIPVPPLRERHGDTAILAAFFLERAARTYGRQVSGFSSEALALLSEYDWPGNVRQLQNVVQRAVLLASGSVVRAAELKEIAADGAGRAATFGDAMRQEKRRRFLDALHQAGGNQSAAARLLGMSRSNFARMMRTLDIPSPRREPKETQRRVAVLDTHQYPSSTKLT